MVVSIELRTTAQAPARLARELLTADPTALRQIWRHSILQLLDDYDTARRAGEPVEELFLRAPQRTGDSRVENCPPWRPPPSSSPRCLSASAVSSSPAPH